MQGGPLAKVRDGDVIRIDTDTGELAALVEAAEWEARTLDQPDLSRKHENMGRELFGAFREHVGSAETGAVSMFGAAAEASAEANAAASAREQAPVEAPA